MDVILSISNWYNFIVDRLAFDALFIPVSILIVFALFNRREYKNKTVLHFILTALTVSLVSRYMYFVYMHMKINTRYLFPVAFYVIILCVTGFMLIIRLLKLSTGRNSRIKEKHLIVFLILIIGAGSIWKALGAPDRKQYIHETAKTIRASNNPVLISNVRDSRRVAWHAKTKLLELSSVTDIDNPVFFEKALDILSSKSQQVFLLVDVKDKDFRKIFSDKKIKFPDSLILIKEFKLRHRRFYSFYKVKYTGKNEDFNSGTMDK